MRCIQAYLIYTFAMMIVVMVYYIIPIYVSFFKLLRLSRSVGLW